MTKELLQTTILSFNLFNAQPIKKAENTQENVILQYFTIKQYEQGSEPTIINKENSTIKTYKNNILQETFTNCIIDFQLGDLSPNNQQIDVWANCQPTKEFNKVEYNFDITITNNNWSGRTPTETKTNLTGIINGSTTPIQSNYTIKSEFTQYAGTNVTISQTILGNNNNLREVTGLISDSKNKPTFTKIKGGTNQETPNDPEIPITPENPDGETNVNYNEVIDIPGLIFTILTLPFTFIQNAFNLTIFKGTPFQLNFADVISLILGCLALITIIKMIMQLKG